MSGIEIAREIVLLGAECAAQGRDDEVIDAHQGYLRHADRWRSLGERMRAHVAIEDRSQLITVFHLPDLSYWLVQICAAVEVYPEAAAAVSIAGEDERLSLLTPVVFARLMTSALGIPFVDALRELVPGGRAERLGLVERPHPMPNRPLSHQPVRLSPAELAVVLGEEPALEPTALPLRREPPASSTGFDEKRVAHAADLMRERGILCIRARSARAGRQFALDIASHIGEPALLVAAGEEIPAPVEIWRLRGGLVVVDLTAAFSVRAFSEAPVHKLACHQRPMVVVVPWNAATHEIATVDVEALDHRTRRRIWTIGAGDTIMASRLADRFGVSLEEVRAATRAARDSARLAGHRSESLDEPAIAAEVMAQGARRMGRMVTRIHTQAHLDHLIVPPMLRQTLDDIVDWYRASPRVRTEWQMAQRSVLGRGLTCLFAGPPGTGKTFAAQCLASVLGLNLYRIDLSQVVSKYIGETEKALYTVFDEAESGHGILLFDEADALFGKRSEVKDAHDRYANIEVGYLLQRLESFEGVSILTTNLHGHIDPAFMRRLSFILEFPMPDARTRKRLWEQSLPPRERWAASIDLELFVERFPLAGGDIHNIGLAAAHLAAARPDGLLRVEHLVRVTYRELEKNGLPRSHDAFGPLAVHLPGR